MTNMNWDRVRKETQIKRCGSEWLGEDPWVPTIGPQTKAPVGDGRGIKSKSASHAGILSGSRPLNRIAGCTCKKAVGFNGQHKKTCPLRNGALRRVAPQKSLKPAPAEEHTPRIKRQLSAVGDFLSSLERQTNANCAGAELHRENIRKLIQVLQKELNDAADSHFRTV